MSIPFRFRKYLRRSVFVASLLLGMAGCQPATLQHESDTDSRMADMPPDNTPPTRIRFVPWSDSGLEFEHVAGRSDEKFMPETMGGGVLVADFNRDQAPDVLFLNSGRMAAADNVIPSPHRLFINRGGGKFEDQTSRWNVKNAGYGMGGAVGDFDNDGLPDLYLTTYGGNDRLLRNTGAMFVDVTQDSKIQPEKSWSTSAAFFDMENDGDLDLYVVKYVDFGAETMLPTFMQGYKTFCTPLMYNAEPDRLLRNNGDGTFTDVSETAGIPAVGKGLAVTAGDIDCDGDVDLYVANDSTANFLLINDGNGEFVDKASLLGVGHSSFGQEEAGMGTDFSDVNQDGLPDIVCTNFQGESTSVYLQHNGYFTEESDGLGVGQTARRRLSFGVDFFDADNDGDEDLFVANGHIDLDVGEYLTGVSFAQQNTIYELRDGYFVDVTSSSGSGMQSKQPSRGMATADLDGDGDLDVIVVGNNSKAEVLQNVGQELGNFLRLWLTAGNGRSVTGARIELVQDSTKMVRELLGGSSYLSASEATVHFGLGRSTKVGRMTILWPNGTQQEFNGMTPGCYGIEQGQVPVRFD